MCYKVYGTTSLYEILNDLVVYRNLIPADRRLPTVDDLRVDLGLADGKLPRKAEIEYGRVVAEMLKAGRALDRPGIKIRHLIYVGDTKLNDGMAFQNICVAGGWPGWALIARDALSAASQTTIEGQLTITNRWSALPAFLAFVEEQGFILGESTAVVIDMDKTAIGARGRNDHVIDAARVEGVERTIAGLLGQRFDEFAFRAAYDELNQSPYYRLTADNQDYLAYICLILGAGLFQLDQVIGDVRSGELGQFMDLIVQVQGRREELDGSGLTPIHDAIWQCVQAGDPTPFKAFRYNEYLTTAARFGDLPGASVDQVLSGRIVITQEVRQAALMLRERGALVFGLSDKPDEASLPSEAQIREGMKPLHHLETLAVGAASCS